MPHSARPAHKANHPAHVTLRVLKYIPSLRRDDLFVWVRHSIAATNQSECPRLGGDMFRIVEYSVQSNHIHLVVEAEDKKTMQSGMTSLATRIARALNRALCRSGKVWAGRYHVRALTVPRYVRNTLVYVLMNHFKHQVKRQAGERAGRSCQPTAAPYPNTFGVDGMSSAPYFNGFVNLSLIHI